MERVENVNVKKLIEILTKISLVMTHCDVSVDKDTNTIRIVGVESENILPIDRGDLTIDQIEELLD